MTYSRLDLWSSSERFSDRLDRKFDMNPILSMNVTLFIVVLPCSVSFLILWENVIYFSVFSPKHSNQTSNSSSYFFNYKLVVTIRTIMKDHRNFSWLQIVWAAQQHFPVQWQGSRILQSFSSSLNSLLSYCLDTWQNVCLLYFFFFFVKSNITFSLKLILGLPELFHRVFTSAEIM